MEAEEIRFEPQTQQVFDKQPVEPGGGSRIPTPAALSFVARGGV